MDIKEDDFTSWLSTLLKNLNTDDDIFGSYIIGILDNEESNEEKTEALEGIVSEIVQNETQIKSIINDILSKWTEYKNKPTKLSNELSSEDVDAKLTKIMESQTLATTKQKQYTEDEKKIREAILSQYGQMTDDEEDQDEKTTAEPKNIEKNVNAEQIINAEKLKREKAKLDSQKKKEKDKEDREKQKQLKEEKKEKRKTQKGERRR